MADLFLPARHQLLNSFLQLFVQPVILLRHVVQLLLQSTLATLITSHKLHWLVLHETTHNTENKKLSCCKETMQCFVSLNIEISLSRSPKVIPNGIRE